MERTYIAIDLKSFYASVECVERNLDPLRTNLVVADAKRTEKTICLAVSPSLKAYGISGRARLFEVVSKVKEINNERRKNALNHKFVGSSADDLELKNNPQLELSFIIAPPRMAYYIDYSTRVYEIYLKYVAPEDMHVYSIDEVFLDVTAYLKTYNMTAHELAMTMILDILKQTGITATAGIGTNLYLCKVAMDIVAKKIPADKNGVRIAQLDEMSYRKTLWNHAPLTDFWRVGSGYAKKLKEYELNTMGDIARCSLGEDNDFYNEDLLYKLFGVNAELLIDHAWGYEPVTIADIKNFQPKENSISSGQVLECPYEADKTRLVVKEMADMLALDLTDKKMLTNQIVLTIGYDIENLTNKEISRQYHGEITTDRYGRLIPKHSHGTINLSEQTDSARLITEAAIKLYDSIIDKRLLTRRITIAACKLVSQYDKKDKEYTEYTQMNLFDDYQNIQKEEEKRKEKLKKEQKLQQAVLDIKKKYGKNAMLKGMNLEEGATAKKRNDQIGGHKA